MTDRDIALLAYDPDPHAVIEPGHEGLSVRLPERLVFAFLGDTVRSCAEAYGMTAVTAFVTVTKTFPVYVGEQDGKPFALVEAPLGAPAAAQLLDWLISYGVRTALAVGSCGVLTDLAENAFLVPRRALRDEGTSFHYLPPSRFVETDETLRRAIGQVFSEKKLPFVEMTTWTTDGFFRETAAKVRARREEGCSSVEMECAALAAVAKFRGARFAQILYTADTLANTDDYNERDWGEASRLPVLRLALEAVLRT